MQGDEERRLKEYELYSAACREPQGRTRRSFGFAQGHESIDIAQDRELVERLVERPAEWQMTS